MTDPVKMVADLAERTQSDVEFWKETAVVESRSRIEAEARLSRVLTICRRIKWIGIGMPAISDGETQEALVSLCEVLFADGIENSRQQCEPSKDRT